LIKIYLLAATGTYLRSCKGITALHNAIKLDHANAYFYDFNVLRLSRSSGKIMPSLALFLQLLREAHYHGHRMSRVNSALT
jgi:hypothetical protein